MRIRPQDITAVILTYNSSRLLAQVLERIRPHTAEIIIVDSYSRDGTVEIAQKYGCKIVFERGDFAHLLNVGLNSARTEWILQIDSDELVDNSVWRAIFGTEWKESVGGMRFLRINYVDGKPTRFFGDDYPIRLFRREGSRFVRGVHQRLVLKGETIKVGAVIHHYPYADWSEYKRKLLRYMSLEPVEPPPTRLRKALRHIVKNFGLKGGWLDGVTGIRLLVYSLYYQSVLMMVDSFGVKPSCFVRNPPSATS